MNVYIVRTQISTGPVVYHVYAARQAISSDQQMFERPLIGYEAPQSPPPETLDEHVAELHPPAQVSVVIDVAAILSQCRTRDGAAELIAAVLAEARKP